MSNEELIKVLEDLKSSLVLNQEYLIAGKVREVIKFLEIQKLKE